jgi:hypothetical protein
MDRILPRRAISMVKESRKTFVAREDLINRISEIAKQSGRSLYDIVNEIFTLAIRANEIGVHMSSALEDEGRLKSAQQKGFILGLERLWYDMAEPFYANSREEALKAWKEAGTWYGKQYTTVGTQDPLMSFKKDFESFTWNVSEFAISRNEEGVTIHLISPRFSEVYSLLLSSFLEGTLEVLGYNIVEREIYAGSVRIKAARKELYGSP